MGLSTIGSMATHLVESFEVSNNVSGNMIEIVDMARQHVENYTGQTIGSNSIASKYQPAILNFSKADLIDYINGQAGGEQLRLAELSLSETGEQLSSKQFRSLAESQLKILGKKAHFARSLS